MNKKILTTIALLTILALTGCGKSKEEPAQKDTTQTVEVQVEKDTTTEETIIEVDNEDTSSDNNEDSVPWDEMTTLGIETFPVGLTGAVNENTIFYPNILFPAAYSISDGTCRASLGGKEYNAYSYAESHMRTLKDTGGLYYEEVGDYIVCTGFGDEIQLKDTVNSYLIHICFIILGADEDFKNEYLIKNCEYITEQLTEMLNDDSTTETTEADNDVLDYINALYTTYKSIYSDKVTVELIYVDGNGNDKIILKDDLNNETLECQLVPLGDNAFGVILNGEQIIDFGINTDGSLDLDTPFEQYANYYGTFTQ